MTDDHQVKTCSTHIIPVYVYRRLVKYLLHRLLIVKNLVRKDQDVLHCRLDVLLDVLHCISSFCHGVHTESQVTHLSPSPIAMQLTIRATCANDLLQCG